MTDLPAGDTTGLVGDQPGGVAPLSWPGAAASGTAAWFHTLLHHSPDLIMVVGGDGRVRYQSPNLERLLGFRPGELAGAHAFALVHPEDKAVVEHLIEIVATRSDLQESARFRVQHRDGSWRWLEVMAGNAHDDLIGGVVVSARDITERAEIERQLKHRAFHDPLTGLPNRALFGDRLTQALRHAQRHGERVAVLSIDLDHFKAINDTMGHETGDQVLIAVGERLLSCISADETIARIGGEEFVVLLERTTTSAALELAQRMLADLRRPVSLPGHEVTVSISIGVAVSGPDLELAEDLLRAADIALYQAKAKGRATIVLLEPPMYTEAKARLAIKFDLQAAIEQGQLCLYYQPVLDLASGHIVGAEALVRWHRPGTGQVAPDEFLPVAEEAGLILALGDWVLREACRQARAWTALCPVPLDIHVNVSPRQLHQHDAAGRVAAALSEHGLPGSCLVLEVREGVLAASGSPITATLRAIRALGVRIAIDDYGGAYSSLGALRSGIIDLLNLNRAVVQGLATDAADRAITQTIVRLARTFGVDVAAEGIETDEQLFQARAVGCRWGQGYFFAPPLPAEAMGDLLASGRPLVSPGDPHRHASPASRRPSGLKSDRRDGPERAAV